MITQLNEQEYLMPPIQEPPPVENIYEARAEIARLTNLINAIKALLKTEEKE